MQEEIILQNFSKRFSTLVKENNVEIQKLVEMLGLRSKSTIYRYMNGEMAPKVTTVKYLSEIFNVNPIWLMGYDVPKEIKHKKLETIKINILGRVAAGRDILAEEEIIDTIDIPKNWTKEGYEYFGLEVHGNSMYPRILNGDYVIVKQQNFVEEDGNIGIVIINGYEAVVKKIYKTKNGLTLRSFNPNYEDINFTIEEVKNLPVTIIGRVVKLIGNDFEE